MTGFSVLRLRPFHADLAPLALVHVHEPCVPGTRSVGLGLCDGDLLSGLPLLASAGQLQERCEARVLWLVFRHPHDILGVLCQDARQRLTCVLPISLSRLAQLEQVRLTSLLGLLFPLYRQVGLGLGVGADFSDWLRLGILEWRLRIPFKNSSLPLVEQHA